MRDVHTLQHRESRTRAAIRTPWGHLDARLGGRYGPLLALMMALYVVAPVLEPQFWPNRLVDLAFYGLILLGTMGATSDWRIRVPVAVGSALAFGLALVTDTVEGGAALANSLANVVLLGVLMGLILADVLAHDTIRLDTVFGAAAVYMVAVVFWAFIYLAIADVSVTAFRIDSPSTPLADYLYFSMSTQTTLGFGDITAATPWTRGVSGIQAILGQLYLVMAIARLVGMEISQSRRREDG